MTFQDQIRQGIPSELPAPKPYDPKINHAPKRREILTEEEKKLAVRNTLRYFEPKHHKVLAKEFMDELNTYGRICIAFVLITGCMLVLFRNIPEIQNKPKLSC